MCILALSVLICTRRRTLRKVTERQFLCMHRYSFTKHSCITKYELPQSPAFPVNILKDFFSRYFFIHIYISLSLHLAYTNAKNHLGWCHSVPCNKNTQEMLNITRGNRLSKRKFTDATSYTQPSIDPNTRSKSFTHRFHKLLAKDVVLSTSHPSGLVFLTLFAVTI